jgi:putative transposase
MKTGRPKQLLLLQPGERIQLESISSSRSLPYSLVQRAQIVLMAADGASNTEIAQQLRLSNPTVGIWRQRYLDYGIQGLHDGLKPGRPRSISDERVATLVRKTLETKPVSGTHWSVRSIAKITRLSHMTVHRIWQAFGLQPHRQKGFKLSTDPFFFRKTQRYCRFVLNSAAECCCAVC